MIMIILYMILYVGIARGDHTILLYRFVAICMATVASPRKDVVGVFPRICTRHLFISNLFRTLAICVIYAIASGIPALNIITQSRLALFTRIYSNTNTFITFTSMYRSFSTPVAIHIGFCIFNLKGSLFLVCISRNTGISNLYIRFDGIFSHNFVYNHISFVLGCGNM